LWTVYPCLCLSPVSKRNRFGDAKKMKVTTGMTPQR
jgi:hypothetical protein